MVMDALRRGVAYAPPPPQFESSLSYDALKGMIADLHRPTAEHSIMVRICAMRIGQAMRLPGLDLNVLSIAAELHDIGKIYIPTRILDNTGKLSESDWQIVRQHPLSGGAAAERSFRSMPDVAVCVRLHHERLDGSGYPYGLSGWRIPQLARIVAVADAFSALMEDRPYRPAYTEAEALHILIVDEAGKYDEELLSALAGCIC